MGMVKVSIENLVRPAGVEKLGRATMNICEQGQMYADASPHDWGQNWPTGPSGEYVSPPAAGAVMVGHSCRIELDHLYLLRAREANRAKGTRKKKRANGVRKRPYIVENNKED